MTFKLPKTYTKELWELGGKVKEHKKYIGLYYTSWSQIESFNDLKGFNTGLLGKYEWILKYLGGASFKDMGWGTFGTEVESYICKKECAEKFSPLEIQTLDKIKPLGVFQDEICYHVKELNIIVLGYIDDRAKEDVDGNVLVLRDYKTKSESSKKDLHSAKKYQIELYILGLRQRNLFVKNAEYCVIERGGGRECMNGGGRDVLYVMDRVWYEPYAIDEKRLEATHQMIIKTATEMSDIYLKYSEILKY